MANLIKIGSFCIINKQSMKLNVKNEMLHCVSELMKKLKNIEQQCSIAEKKIQVLEKRAREENEQMKREKKKYDITQLKDLLFDTVEKSKTYIIKGNRVKNIASLSSIPTEKNTDFKYKQVRVAMAARRMLGHEIYAWKLKVINITNTIGFGLGKRDVIITNNFLLFNKKIHKFNHGLYVLTSSGDEYNCGCIDLTGKCLSLKNGDIVELLFNGPKQELEVLKDDFFYKIFVYGVKEFDDLVPVVLLSENGEEVALYE